MPDTHQAYPEPKYIRAKNSWDVLQALEQKRLVKYNGDRCTLMGGFGAVGTKLKLHKNGGGTLAPLDIICCYTERFEITPPVAAIRS